MSTNTNPLYSVANNKQRVSQAERNKNDFQWYHAQADILDAHSFGGRVGYGGVSDYHRKKVNYDLFNNIINLRDLEYVCRPYGAEVGEMPAVMTNRDIVSSKLKVLLGMEMKMPFSWKVVATNPEATTRKEQAEFKMIRDYVEQEIMRPIKQEVAQNALAQSRGRQLTPEEQQQVQQQVAEETRARTPEEVRKYMTREHQDPAEALSRQILEYLIQKERIPDKFNKGFKHSMLAGEEIYWVGIIRGEPSLKVINSLFFDCDQSPDVDYIEDREWAVAEYRMSPAQVVAELGDELTEEEIDRIYDKSTNAPSQIMDADFTFETDRAGEGSTVRVLHCVWKSLMKMGFLTYWSDATDKEEMKIVDENYKFDVHGGDIDIEWEWIPQTHETYKVLNDIYLKCRAVPGQNKDLSNLFTCKLPYYGAVLDNLNSPVTSPMDRMKTYQYFYDVILYRIEMLMASDKGKIIVANLNAVPKSLGIDINHLMYFMDANKIMWLNPQEEGNRGGQGGDVNNLAHVLDLSLISDIWKYVQLAEFIEKKCGESIGVTKPMEGAISPTDAVTNSKQNLIQASHIIQPYFELHNIVKANTLQGLIDVAKVAYAIGKPKHIPYVLDDMSMRLLDLSASNIALLDNSTLGLFVANSSKADDAKRAVDSLAQAAMQTQQADLSDIIKVIRSESIQEAEELLDTARNRKQEELQAIDKQKMQAEKEARLAASQEKAEDRKHEKEMIILKEGERRKTEIQKQTILSLGFNEDKDMNKNQVPDVLEIAEFGVDKDIKTKKLAQDDKALDHQIKTDNRKLDQADEKLEQGEKKLAIDKQKAAQKPKTSS